MKWEKTEIGNLKVDRTHCAQKSVAPIQQCVHHLYLAPKASTFPRFKVWRSYFPHVYLIREITPGIINIEKLFTRFAEILRKEKGKRCSDSGDLVKACWVEIGSSFPNPFVVWSTLGCKMCRVHRSTHSIPFFPTYRTISYHFSSFLRDSSWTNSKNYPHWRFFMCMLRIIHKKRNSTAKYYHKISTLRPSSPHGLLHLFLSYLIFHLTFLLSFQRTSRHSFSLVFILPPHQTNVSSNMQCL